MGRMMPQDKKPSYHLAPTFERTRVEREITQEALAERAELNPRTLQKIEAGQTNILITTAMRLREALGCDWEDLMPESPAVKKPASKKK